MKDPLKYIISLTKAAAVFICFIASPLIASVNQPVINKYLSDAEVVGEARMTYLIWKVYDARLFATNGSWQPGQPLALELSYLRKLNGGAIAERSIEEIRGQGYANENKLDQWLDQMREIFPDVNNTSSLVGIADDQRHTRFYFNGKFIGEVDDPDFTRQFFNIWLGENTSDPKLRQQLLTIN